MNVTDKAESEASFILPEHRTLVRTEQVATLFRYVDLNALGSAAAAVLLATALIHLGVTDEAIGLAWVSSTAICVAAHLILRRIYHRRPPSDANWQRWAWSFTAISLVEGITWGWASVYLAPEGFFEIQMLVLAVTFGVAAGAIPARSSYLPSFCVLFFPATIPYVLLKVGDTSQVQQISGLFMLVYIAGMGGLAFNVNRNFKAAVDLRVRLIALAERLRQQKELADEANRAKSRFLAAASHDLRQPVHALGLFIGALRRVVMPLEGQRLIEQIEESTVAMDGLFSTLLDISQLDAGTVEVHRQSFPMGTLLERICRDHQAEATAKGLSLVWARSTAVINCDPVLLERILRNLVANAVRYTNHGRVLVGCRRKGATISIQVLDTGPGIPPDQRDRVFQEYYQLGNPERDRAKGLGLGLAIVRRLVDLLGCEMTLRSRVGHGSCFEVSVPMATGGIPASKDPLEAISGALAHGFIVVIDDELAIRNAMSALLTGWGYETIVVGSGDEAIRQLSNCEQRPDLIICDYRLRDGENGIRVIERLRSEYNEAIPAMLITGDTAPDRLAEAKASSLLLLHKPVSNGKLRAAIVNLITKKRVSGEMRTHLAAIK
jgi:signal transduction histidine kinase/CheY-like chemotaxis protein